MVCPHECWLFVWSLGEFISSVNLFQVVLKYVCYCLQLADKTLVYVPASRFF